MDPLKAQYCLHNAKLYNLETPSQYQVVHSDFLKLNDNFEQPHFTFPDERHHEFDAVFLSPPWGGTGYQYLHDGYTLDHVFPDFDLMM